MVHRETTASKSDLVRHPTWFGGSGADDDGDGSGGYCCSCSVAAGRFWRARKHTIPAMNEAKATETMRATPAMPIATVEVGKKMPSGGGADGGGGDGDGEGIWT